MDIQSLRKMRNNDLAKITAEFQKSSQGGGRSFEDTRFWKPERDKAGNASATIRFLPNTEADQLPWVKVYSHGFQGPTGKWYIEESLTTIGQTDPVAEINSKLWNSGIEANKEIARKQGRRTHYIANILVVDDPKHPENNGKVFLFKFGKKIFDKIMDKANPTFEDEDPVNVFDYWEGANFKLRMKQVEGYPNYDTSAFQDPTPVAEDDEDIVAIANKQFALSEFVDPKKFKSYEELKRKLADVLNEEYVGLSAAQIAEKEDIPVRSAPAPKAAPAPEPKATKPAPEVTDDDDDVSAYFAQLAEED